ISPFINKQNWRKTSIYDIFEKHKSKASEGCNNFCNLTSDMGCEATKIEDWQKCMLSPNFKFMPLLADFEYIYPFEVDYLSYPPMTDSRQLPNVSLSKVYMDGAANGEISCAINDTLRGRVDLVDDFGKHRTIGGDEVRVWMVDKQTQTYKAAGHVTDLRNGSYQISVRCLWPGKSQLNVAVAYPREYLRVVIQHIHKGIGWYYAVKFRRQNIEEVTVCSATPNIPGRSCVCNLTSVNQQSLYCGRPVDSRLTCEDWVETFSLPIPPPHNVTPAENNLIKTIPRPISERTISHNITIVAKSTGQLPKLKPCSETSPASTWDTEYQPQGYWTSNNWQSLICERPKMTAAWTISCLKNSSVWVFGDSNGVRLVGVTSALTQAEKRTETWPEQFIKTDQQNGIHFIFTPLEYPVYLGQAWRRRLPYGGVAKQIDQIPSNGTHLLMIHYYLHITPSHLNIAYLRLTAVRDAIQRLLARNPNVVVGIRGPHVSSVELNFNHAVGGDNLGRYLLAMTRHVFVDLMHKVILLDGWEMTVALENSWYHPVNTVPAELVRTLLAFKCS
ncbi:unnamed protein product, partial [Candidula unifasciata]